MKPHHVEVSKNQGPIVDSKIAGLFLQGQQDLDPQFTETAISPQATEVVHQDGVGHWVILEAGVGSDDLQAEHPKDVEHLCFLALRVQVPKYEGKNLNHNSDS